MSQTLVVDNYGTLNLVEQTKLNADSAAAATNFTVENNQAFAAADVFVIGELGSETLEKLIVSSASGGDTVVSTAGAVRAHLRFDDVHKLFGTKIKIYRASNVDGTAPADADFAALVTVTIDFDQATTEYTDSGGSSSYWYKFVYYNDTSTTETALSDSVAVRGGNYGNYCSIANIRQESGFHNPRRITDGMVDTHRQAAQAEINSRLVGKYTVPFTTPISPTIQRIATLLSAGFLLNEQYQYALNNPGDVHPKVREARAMLDAIIAGTTPILDEGGSPIANPDATAVRGWPDATTADAELEDGGAARAFRMGMRF